MTELRAPRAVWIEVAKAIAIGVCGHSPPDLSPEARALVEQMEACHHKYKPVATDAEESTPAPDKP